MFDPKASPDFLSDLRFIPSSELTEWLVSLKDAIPTPADPASDRSNAVEVVELGSDYSLEPELPNGRGTIFIHPCYAKLLNEIWKHNRVALIADPGVGKSCFQEYVLLRIVQSASEHFEEIDDPPSCVIRQVGKDCFQLFLINEAKAFEVESCSRAFLYLFDPKECLYLFEPSSDKLTKPFFSRLKTIATVPPNPRRINEYTKRRAVKMCLPTWGLDELKQIGTYLGRSVRECDTGFSEAEVEERFDIFGGILRYVFPFSDREQILRLQAEARTRLRYSVLLSKAATADSDGKDNVSQLFLRHDVDQTTFESYTRRFSPFAQRCLIEAGGDIHEYCELRKLLSKCARGLHAARRSQYLEIGVPLMWHHGVDWTKTGGASLSLPRKLELSLMRKDAWPKAADMTENRLYTSTDCRHTFVSAYFKHAGKVHGILCKPGNSAEAPEASPALTFRDNIELADTDDLYVWYIVFSDSAEALWKTVQKGFTTASSEKLDEDQKKRMESVEKATHFGVLTHDFGPLRLNESTAISSK
jgi:hypothetical protein